MGQRIFEFAVLLHPTEKEAEEGGQSVIIVGTQQVLANSEQQAAMLAGRAIPDEHLDKLDRVEVAIRPF